MPCSSHRVPYHSFGNNHHDSTVIQVPQNQPVDNTGFNHTALVIDGSEKELVQIYRQLQDKEVQSELTADHGLSKSVYLHNLAGAYGKRLTTAYGEHCY